MNASQWAQKGPAGASVRNIRGHVLLGQVLFLQNRMGRPVRN
jgi:hypothetical protein